MVPIVYYHDIIIIYFNKLFQKRLYLIVMYVSHYIPNQKHPGYKK